MLTIANVSFLLVLLEQIHFLCTGYRDCPDTLYIENESVQVYRRRAHIGTRWARSRSNYGRTTGHVRLMKPPSNLSHVQVSEFCIYSACRS